MSSIQICNKILPYSSELHGITSKIIFNHRKSCFSI